MRAIVAGKCDPRKWAEFSDRRNHASEQEIIKSLAGIGRSYRLFMLDQKFEMYDVYQRRLAEGDQESQ